MAKKKDGTTKPFDTGDAVLYIPQRLSHGDKGAMVDKKNLGVVTSKNDVYVFVRYAGDIGSELAP